MIHFKTQEIESGKADDVDILFLGSSHVLRSFDPRIFREYNIKIFNFGSSFQTHIQTQLLLYKYLDRLNPKLVIYDVYPDIFGADGVESSLEFIHNEFPLKDMWSEIIDQNHLIIYNSIIFRLYKKVTGQQYRVYPGPSEDEIYIPGGYVETISSEGSIDLIKDSVTVTPQLKQLEAFRENLSYLKAKDYKYLLIDIPVTDRFCKSHTNAEELNESIATISDFYSFQDSIDLVDEKHFLDYNHLNQEGVDLFNHYFINWLKSRNIYDAKKN